MRKIILFLMFFSFQAMASKSLMVKSGYHYYLSNSSNEDIQNKKSETKHNLKLVLGFMGKIEDSITYNLKLNPIHTAAQNMATCTQSGVYVASLKMQVNDLFDLKAGCMHVNTGGWENRNLNSMSHYAPNIANMITLPLKKYDLGLELGFNLFGRLSLQFFEDPQGSYRSNPGYMTLAASWNGNFSGFEPIVQFAMYDEQKSQIFGLGLKTELMGLSFRADFQQDKKKYKYGEDNKEDTATTTVYSAFVSYSMLDILIPYLRYQNISKDKENGVKNDKNTVWGGTSDTGSVMSPMNNGQVLTLGFDMKYNEKFVPYFSANMHSGKFTKASDANASEDLSNWVFRLGFTGMF